MSFKRVGAGLEGFSPVESIDTPEKNISCVDFVSCDSSCVGSKPSASHNIHEEIGVVSGGVEKVEISAERVSGGVNKVDSSGVLSSGDTVSGRVGFCARGMVMTKARTITREPFWQCVKMTAH